jgi:hypothetical protein
VTDYIATDKVTARTLAREGALHAAFLLSVKSKEYDIPDDTPMQEIDQALLRCVVADLRKHKETCSGCTPHDVAGVREMYRK